MYQVQVHKKRVRHDNHLQAPQLLRKSNEEVVWQLCLCTFIANVLPGSFNLSCQWGRDLSLSGEKPFSCFYDQECVMQGS